MCRNMSIKEYTESANYIIKSQYKQVCIRLPYELG